MGVKNTLKAGTWKRATLGIKDLRDCQYFEEICLLGGGPGHFTVYSRTRQKEIKMDLFIRMDVSASNHCHQSRFFADFWVINIAQIAPKPSMYLSIAKLRAVQFMWNNDSKQKQSYINKILIFSSVSQLIVETGFPPLHDLEAVLIWLPLSNHSTSTTFLKVSGFVEGFKPFWAPHSQS